MKKRFEIVSAQKNEPAVSNQELRAPKKTGRQQRADENGREQINQESGCVLQAACPFSGIGIHVLAQPFGAFFRCLLRCSSITDPPEDMLPPSALHAAK